MFVNGWISNANCTNPVSDRLEFAIPTAGGKDSTARTFRARKSATVTVWLNVLVLTSVLVRKLYAIAVGLMPMLNVNDWLLIGSRISTLLLWLELAMKHPTVLLFVALVL